MAIQHDIKKNSFGLEYEKYADGKRGPFKQTSNFMSNQRFYDNLFRMKTKNCWKLITFGLRRWLSRPVMYQLLSHCGLVMPTGDIGLGKHWLRLWLATWRHQAITLTNCDLSSVMPSEIHLKSLSHKIHQSWITKNYFCKITFKYLRDHCASSSPPSAAHMRQWTGSA